MWVRDVHGGRVNLSLSPAIDVSKREGEALKGLWAGDWFLYEGTDEDCDRYLAGLDRLLGVVDPLATPADVVALTQDDCATLAALLSGVDLERLLKPHCIPQAVGLMERITDAAVGWEEAQARGE